ncbi:MAG: ABC transporter permease subunit [Lachnospiraceae bacterium]
MGINCFGCLRQFGSSMLIFLSGLKQVPISLYEAATVDGATGITKFFKITLPMLTPTIFFNLINQLIHGFMAFTQELYYHRRET